MASAPGHRAGGRPEREACRRSPPDGLSSSPCPQACRLRRSNRSRPETEVHPAFCRRSLDRQPRARLLLPQLEFHQAKGERRQGEPHGSARDTRERDATIRDRRGTPLLGTRIPGPLSIRTTVPPTNRSERRAMMTEPLLRRVPPARIELACSRSAVSVGTAYRGRLSAPDVRRVRRVPADGC